MHWFLAHCAIFHLFLLGVLTCFRLSLAALAASRGWPATRLLVLLGLVDYLKLCGRCCRTASGTGKYGLLFNRAMKTVLPPTTAAHATRASKTHAQLAATATDASFACILLEELLATGPGKQAIILYKMLDN